MDIEALAAKRKQINEEEQERLSRIITRRSSSKTITAFAEGDGIESPLLASQEAIQGGDTLRQQTKRLANAFDTIDEDGDGFLDPDELVAALKKIGNVTSDIDVPLIIKATKEHFQQREQEQRAAGGDVDAKDGGDKTAVTLEAGEIGAGVEVGRSDSLSFEEFVWAVENHDLCKELYHGKSKFWFGLNESHVPKIDYYCSRYLPVAFVGIVVFMLLIETPQMAYSGPHGGRSGDGGGAEGGWRSYTRTNNVTIFQKFIDCLCLIVCAMHEYR
jgi:hypothetical protein